MKKNKIIFFVCTLLISLTIIILVYLNTYYKPLDEALLAMQDNNEVLVTETEHYYSFVSKSVESSVGYIFYSGGKVDERAYAPLMKDLANEGITCILLKIPFHLAMFSINAADNVYSDFSNISSWYVGGHSLGGAMAATYASANSEYLKGVILMAAYSTQDLTDTNLRLLSFYGTNDRVLNQDSFSKYKVNNPLDTQYFEIDGGNHAYYGTYGEQKGDGTSSITAIEQQQIVTNEIIEWIHQK